MSKRKPIRVGVVSLGCPKNLVDTEKMLADLAEAGCVVGAPLEEADAILINTCGFLAEAREEALEMLAEAREHKKAGRCRRIVLAGCLPSRDGAALAELEGVDAIVGVGNRQDVLAAILGRGASVRLDGRPGPRAAPDAGRFRLTAPHTAYLRISEGCSHRCTFCTIPDIRGPFRSKEPADVLAEAAELLADGAVELNLIGQDTTAYGSDLDGPMRLADLLERLGELEGAGWLRLLYTHPAGFDDRLIGAIADNPAVVPYVDMPLQHIADGVLRRMGRRVDQARTLDLLARMRERIPGLWLRTTLITGFPGESEADFAQLLEFVQDQRFEALGVFAFSPEPGTPAARLDGQVPAELAHERAQTLMLAQQKIILQRNAEMIGQDLEVLVDAAEGSQAVGRHAGQAPEVDSVCFVDRPVAPGQIVPCEVIDYSDYDLIVTPAGVEL